MLLQIKQLTAPMFCSKRVHCRHGLLGVLPNYDQASRFLAGRYGAKSYLYHRGNFCPFLYRNESKDKTAAPAAGKLAGTPLATMGKAGRDARCYPSSTTLSQSMSGIFGSA